MFPDFILFNSTPCVCFIRANGQWCFITPSQKSLVKRRWQGIYFPTVLSLFSTYFLLGLHLIRNQRGHTFAITTVSLKFSALCHHPPFAHTNPKTDCPQANRKYVFCMGEDKNTCTDDTPLGRRKQKVPQTTDETGNIAAILSNRPTVRQILTSAGLILIALCTVRASWIKYWLGLGRIEQNKWIL